MSLKSPGAPGLGPDLARRLAVKFSQQKDGEQVLPYIDAASAGMITSGVRLEGGMTGCRVQGARTTPMCTPTVSRASRSYIRKGRQLTVRYRTTARYQKEWQISEMMVRASNDRNWSAFPPPQSQVMK